MASLGVCPRKAVRACDDASFAAATAVDAALIPLPNAIISPTMTLKNQRSPRPERLTIAEIQGDASDPKEELSLA